MLRTHMRNVYRNEADPDGADEGAVGTATPPPPPPRSYTEDEVNNREAKLRRSFERKMREQEAEMAKKLAALEAKIPTTPHEPSAPQSAAGELEVRQQRWEREREELKAQQDALKAELEREKQSRLELQRDRLIDDALSALGVTEQNLKPARRFVMPDVVWDDIDSEWMFKTPRGNLIAIKDGVEEFLPDSLKPPKVRGGGAGTSSGMPATAMRVQRDLDAAKEEVEKLRKHIARNPQDNGYLAKFSQAKQKVQQLELSLSKSLK